eukprot:TRINITY_DN70_c1_g1_i1.p3 TRINITY_DN70_c1_g1~~TRINITY_DN70_c1_g1_i1.p3  ORF type:complete len:174 (-),score=45.49 TRINITY_DN70_c1_g1_i1:431-952(-)
MSSSSNAADHRSFFWTGVLTRGTDTYSFFDVKVKKGPPIADGSCFQIYTSDLPPIPVRKNDVFHASFMVESNSGYTSTVRYRLADATVHGSLLEGKTTVGSVLAITTDDSEWHFSKRSSASTSSSALGGGGSSVLTPKPAEDDKDADVTWVLYFVSVRVPTSSLKKFLPRIHQ